MKNIIVPTDFSPASANAYAYARAFAALTDRPIKVVHITYPGTYVDFSLPSPSSDTRSTKQRKLDQFVNQWEADQYADILTTLHIEQEVIFGAPVEELVKLSKESETDFIIMGTTGTKGALNNFLGTVSSNVSQKAHCPVWLIPPNVSFNGINNILYTGNYESADKRMLDSIIDLSNVFESTIHLVHIDDPNNKKGDWRFEEFVLKQLLSKKAPKFPIELHIVQSESFWDSINDYVQKNDIDLMVMVTRHRTLLEEILHKSKTKSMIVHSKIPLLVLHLDDPM